MSELREFWTAAEERNSWPREHLDLRHNSPKWDAIWDDDGGWAFSDDQPDEFQALMRERNALLAAEEVAGDGIEVNDRGGKQSKLSARFDLLPPAAVVNVARVLDEGAKKYGERNWRKISTDEHLNHAIGHIFAYLYNPEISLEDLEHAATRLLFALEIALVGEDE